MQTPLDADLPPGCRYAPDADPPGGRPCLDKEPPGCRPPHPGHVTCDACRGANPLPTVDRRNDTHLWKYYLVSMFCLDTLRTWLWNDHVSVQFRHFENLAVGWPCFYVLFRHFENHVSVLFRHFENHVSMFCLDTLRTWLWDCWRSVTVRMRSEQGWCWFVKWNSSVWYTYYYTLFLWKNKNMLS